MTATLPPIKFETVAVKTSVADLVRGSLATGRHNKMVIFAIYRDVIDGLCEKLKPYAPLVIYRKTKPFRRDYAIGCFQQIAKHRVLICSIKAAQIPMDLTVAHRIVFAEAELLQHLNAQAVLRVYRRGQTQPVNVRFVEFGAARPLMRETRRLVENFHE